jgi:hypothetical protein
MIGTISRAPGTTRRFAAVLAAALVLALSASIAHASPEGGATTVTGTVTRVQASERAVTVKLAEGGETRFVWTNDTRITGVLTPGARVTIRYVVGDAGENHALQITVGRS